MSGLRLGVLSLLLAATAPTPADELRVGMDPRQPPWAFVPGLSDYCKEDQRRPPALPPAQLKDVTGLDVEVLQALARRLGVTARIVPTAWFSLEERLLDGSFDAILSSWTPSPRTPDTIASTRAYADWGLRIVAPASNTSLASYRDLEGRRVGHYDDPAVRRSLEAMGKGRFEAFDCADRLFAQLKRGRLDAAIYDSVYVDWLLAREPGLRVVGEPLNRLGYHVGVRRADTQLLERLQAAVQELVGSGEAAQIRNRWQQASAPH